MHMYFKHAYLIGLVYNGMLKYLVAFSLRSSSNLSAARQGLYSLLKSNGKGSLAIDRKLPKVEETDCIDIIPH